MAAQVTTETPKPHEPQVNTLREKGRPSFQHLHSASSGPYPCLWSVYCTKTDREPRGPLAFSGGDTVSTKGTEDIHDSGSQSSITNHISNALSKTHAVKTFVINTECMRLSKCMYLCFWMVCFFQGTYFVLIELGRAGTWALGFYTENPPFSRV